MIIDVNAYLERWPFRRVPCDEPAGLIRKLDAAGIRRLWVGSFDALLHEDVEGVNRRLVEACARAGAKRLVPFGCVNPSLPDWREDLRRCHEVHRMPGIRLHPNYHQYDLDAPQFVELLRLAERYDLIVQLAVRMEDVRTQHPLLRVPDVNLQPLVRLVGEFPRLRLVVLNGLRTVRGALVARLVEAGRVWFDIAMLEGAGGIARLLDQVPADRLLFGSYLPLFPVESALMKLRESELPPETVEAISHQNAARLL